MRNTVYILLLFFCFQRASAQDSTNAVKFIRSGTIEYERKENERNEFTGEGDFADEIRKNMPEYKTTYFNLSFSGNVSLFQPGRDNPDNSRMWVGPGSTNVVYADRGANRQVSQKDFEGSALLLTDSLRECKWRITNDTRVIAGFECRRATTVIMDSVFVVVFYTDEILSPSGPESFGGLPGMILGMVIPKLHTSWYATKVVMGDPTGMTPPKKGTKMNYIEMAAILKDRTKDWGSWAQTLMLRIML
jgi:GLPGLI family protein